MNTFSKHRFKRRPTLVQDNDTYFSAHRLTLVFWTPIDTCSAQGKRIWFQDADRPLFRTSLVLFSTHVFVLNMRARELWTWSCICVENEKVLVLRMSMCWCVEKEPVFVLQTSGHWCWTGERISVEMTMNWCWQWESCRRVVGEGPWLIPVYFGNILIVICLSRLILGIIVGP